MIHLDTNALIELPGWIINGHPVIDRVRAGDLAAASAIAWYEFVTGPVDDAEIRLAEAFIEQRIIPLDADHAQLAAQIFNSTGRKRKLKIDVLIAATAIHANAEFLTGNLDDFRPFISSGLKLFAS